MLLMVLFAKSLILWWGLGGLEFACPLLTRILYWSLAALQKLWLTAQKRISKSPKKRSVSRSPSGSRSRSRSLSRSHSSQLCFSVILCSQSLRFWLCTFFFTPYCFVFGTSYDLIPDCKLSGQVRFGCFFGCPGQWRNSMLPYLLYASQIWNSW